jgi:TPR repeat protein
MSLTRYLLAAGIALGSMILSVPFAIGFMEGFNAVGASVAAQGHETVESIEQEIAGCEMGVVESCVHAGMHLRDKEDRFADQPRAYAAFQRACVADIPDGCALAGVMLQLGRGVEADPKRALRLYEDSCSAGSAEGCGALSSSLANGSLGQVDEQRSIEIGNRACSLGDRMSCSMMASRQRDGEGVAQNVDAALANFKTLCERGDNEACREVFFTLHRPALAAPMIANLREANRYLGLACDRGHQDSCTSQRQNIEQIAELEATL